MRDAKSGRGVSPRELHQRHIPPPRVLGPRAAGVARRITQQSLLRWKTACRFRCPDPREQSQITDGHSEEVRLEFSEVVAPFIMEREWHRSQKITANPDGSIVLTMKVAHTLDLECFILRWAGDVRVLEGKTLRQAIRKRALALAEACGVVSDEGVGH